MALKYELILLFRKEYRAPVQAKQMKKHQKVLPAG